MTTYRREFSVQPASEREVSFVLQGAEFRCVPDISMGAMEEYRAGQVRDPNNPTTVGVPLDVNNRFIEQALANEADVEEFRKLRSALPLNNGAETLHAIREYLVECYAEVGPTNGPQPSSAGPPVSGPTLRDVSGSPDETPTPSLSEAS